MNKTLFNLGFLILAIILSISCKKDETNIASIGVTIIPERIILNVGMTDTLTASIDPEDATNKNVSGFLTKNETVPINPCIPEVNKIVGTNPIIIQHKKAKILITTLITDMRRENVLSISDSSF
jgi:hypothetical protein